MGSGFSNPQFVRDPKTSVLADDQDSMIYGQLFHIVAEPTDIIALCGNKIRNPETLLLSPEGPVCRKCVMALVRRFGG